MERENFPAEPEGREEIRLKKRAVWVLVALLLLVYGCGGQR